MFNLIKSVFSRKQEPELFFKFNEKERGWAPSNWPWSGFQRDIAGHGHQVYGPVFSCVAIISQEIAKLPIHHYRVNEDGSKTRLFNTVPTRVMRKPNKYQTRSEFWLYMMENLLYGGNGYALATRNNRREISALLPLGQSAHPHINPKDNDLYYRIGTNAFNIVDEKTINELVPARNILHLKTYTPKSPLIGVTPLTAAAYSADLGLSIEKNGASFFTNMARPSGVIKVPNKLGKEARTRIKDAWKEAFTKQHMGNIGVLSDGAEWQQITMTAQDAAIVDQHKMTIEDVARVFRVPLFMLGDLEKSTFNNVESTLKFFYSGALSFYMEHIEASLQDLFMLPADEMIQFDFESNLRTETLARIDALSKGVAGGVYKVNEARAKEGLGKVKGGENVFIQNQMQTVDDRATNTPLTPTPTAAPNPEPEEITPEDAKLLEIMITKAAQDEF